MEQLDKSVDNYIYYESINNSVHDSINAQAVNNSIHQQKDYVSCLINFFRHFETWEISYYNIHR